jgi:hypothetical protein
MSSFHWIIITLLDMNRNRYSRAGRHGSLTIPFADMALAERVATALRFAMTHVEQDVF